MMTENVFLILLRLGMDDTSPLRQSQVEADGSLPRMAEGKQYRFVAGLLDPARQSTSTPLIEIDFNGPKKKTYNRILGRLEKLFKLYYEDTSGYVLDPSRLNQERQEEVGEAIDDIGMRVYDLIPNHTAIHDWLQGVFKRKESTRHGAQHVTIITNDFAVPWFWMKAADDTPLLCEVCSLGMLQLSSGTFWQPMVSAETEGWEKREPLRALLIDGSTGSDLPLVADELEAVGKVLKTEWQRGRSWRRPLVVDCPEQFGGVSDLWLNKKKHELLDLFRLVHYTGHWDFSQDSFRVGGEEWKPDVLSDFVKGSALVLDGCSSSRGLHAWEDAAGLTAQLINMGALGCIVTVLPVKNDPIVAEVFWGTFYKDLRKNPEDTTLGRALTNARQALKSHFKLYGSVNPAWAFYQLIGNPSVCPLRRGSDHDG
jgi:hypothetical protein